MSNQPSRPPRRRLTGLVLFAAAAVVAIVAYGGYRVYRASRPRYAAWKAAHAVVQARALFKAGDYAGAQVALQVAFDSGPTDDAYRLLADMLEAANAKDAVYVRRRLLQGAPGDAGLRLALVETAIRFRDDGTAEEAVAGFPEGQHATREYRRAAASWAVYSGDWATAVSMLDELDREPGADPGGRVLRAAILTHSTRVGRAMVARAELRRMAHEPATRIGALRVLARYASETADRTLAGEVGDGLEAAPESTFDDLIAAAQAQAFARPAAGASAALVARIEAAARTDPAHADEYVHALVIHRHADKAQAWLDGLGPPLAGSDTYERLQSYVLVARADWEGLRPHLSTPAWGSLSAGAVEFAYVGRLARTRGNTDLAAQAWASALDATVHNGPGLRGLARLAAAWNWADAMKSAWAEVIHETPKDSRPYIELSRILRAERDTRALSGLVSKWAEAFPDDRLQSDAAMLSMLVDRPSGPNIATAALARLHDKDPANPYLATNYAYSLLLLGQPSAAAALVDRMEAVERARPERAPFLASIYVGAGRLADARAMLAAAGRPRGLLREEEELLARARQAVGLR